MSNSFDGWEIIGEPLGEGGQGTVHKARNPKRVEQLKQASKLVEQEFRLLIKPVRAPDDPPFSGLELARRLVPLVSPDPIEDLGALKQFKVPNEAWALRAVARLESEIKALGELNGRNHPGILRLLHHNARERFIVTEFHPDGTLDQHLDEFKGKPLRALEAFRPLVDAVNVIHQNGAIHRDIKPENIFVGTDGRLVLGDFGIVFFFKDPEGPRFTHTDERVGTHYWMPPWAYAPTRLAIEKVNPTLDLYPLAKVLWAMIAGDNGFSFWEYDTDANNLQARFPDDPWMLLVNKAIFAKCIVRQEDQCLQNAMDLLEIVDGLIAVMRRAAERPLDNQAWPCRICRRGHYQKAEMESSLPRVSSVGHPEGAFRIQTYVCDYCKHVQLFQG